MNSPIPEEAISSGPGSVMARPDNELILQAAIDEYNQNHQRLETQSVADDKSTLSQMDIDLEEIEDRIIELQDTVSKLIEQKENIEMFKIVSKIHHFRNHLTFEYFVESVRIFNRKSKNIRSHLQIQASKVDKRESGEDQLHPRPRNRADKFTYPNIKNRGERETIAVSAITRARAKEKVQTG